MTRLKIQTARQCHNKLKVQLAILASITIGLSDAYRNAFGMSVTFVIQGYREFPRLSSMRLKLETT